MRGIVLGVSLVQISVSELPLEFRVGLSMGIANIKLS